MLVDEYSKLDAEYTAFSPKIARRKKLRELILAWYPELPGDQAKTISGVSYDLMIGLAEEQNKITNLRKVWKALGATRFVDACSMTLKALREALGETEAAEYLTCERTGPRSLTPVIRQKEAA